MKKRMTAGLIALGLIGGAAAADDRGVQVRNVDGAADAYVTLIDGNDGDRLLLDHYRINHGETFSVAPAFGADHTYHLKWRAERTNDHKAKDGECWGQNTPCGIDFWNAK